MIVTCDSCFTKFRLDGSKISTKGRKVRCSRCQHTFSVLPPPMIKEEIPEDSGSPAQSHEPLIEPVQKKVEVSPPLETEKTAEDGETPSSYKETITEKTEQMVPEKLVREERIKVKTFQIDKNSFRIEWNV